MDHIQMRHGVNTISIKLTQSNGNTREVAYEVAGDRDRAQILFNTLKDAAWAASPYSVDSAKRAERSTTDDVMGRSLLDRVEGKR